MLNEKITRKEVEEVLKGISKIYIINLLLPFFALYLADLTNSRRSKEKIGCVLRTKL